MIASRLLYGLTLLLVFVGIAKGQTIPRTLTDSIDWPVSQSPLVVRGKIVSEEKVTSPATPFPHMVKVTVKVQETLKGEKQDDLTFVTQEGQHYYSGTLWEGIGKDLVVLLNESKRSNNYLMSRYRYTSAGVIDFEKPDVKGWRTRDNVVLEGREDALNYLRKAIVAQTAKAYKPGSKQIEGGWQLLVPEPSDDLQPADFAPRFLTNAIFDGTQIFATRGNDVCQWNATDGSLIRTYKAGEESAQSISIAPERQSLAVGYGNLPNSFKHEIRLFPIGSESSAQAFDISKQAVTRLEYLGNQYRLLADFRDMGSTRWLQPVLNTFSGETTVVYPGHHAKVSLDKSLILSGEFGDQFDSSFWVGVWDANTGIQLCTIRGEGDDHTFHTAEFSPWGNRIVTAGKKGLEVWNAETGALLYTMPGSFWSGTWTPDGRYVVGSMHQGKVVVYDAWSGRELRQLDCPRQPFELMPSPSGKTLLVKWGDTPAFGSRLGSSLFDLDSGKELARYDGDPANLIGFSPDGKTFCGFDANRTHASIWDANTGKGLKYFELK